MSAGHQCITPHIQYLAPHTSLPSSLYLVLQPQSQYEQARIQQRSRQGRADMTRSHKSPTASLSALTVRHAHNRINPTLSLSVCVCPSPLLPTTQQTVCIVGCVVFWAILITIGILLIFLVRIPSASVASTSVQCNSPSQCQTVAASGGIPVQVNMSIHNPNILSAYVQSTDLVLTDRSNGQRLATGVIERQYVSSRSDSSVVAMFNFPAGTETTSVIVALYSGSSVPINVDGHLDISVGALSFSYHLNQDETIPAQ